MMTPAADGGANARRTDAMGIADEMTSRELTLRAMYEHFNARRIEGVLDALADDVEWANGMDGGVERGKDAVREYWTRQWAIVSPRVTPVSIDSREIGRTVVTVRQELATLSGDPAERAGALRSETVLHVFRFEGDRVVRFDIGKPR